MPLPTAMRQMRFPLPPLRAASGALLAAAACLILPGAAIGVTGHTLVDDEHSTETTHGLYEIREEARKFMVEENRRAHTGWVVGDPDLKTLVPRCAVPLKVKWVPESYGLTNKSVMVYCTKPVKPYSSRDQWDVAITVFPPPDTAEMHYNIAQAASAVVKKSRPGWEAGYANVKRLVGKCQEPLQAVLDKPKAVVNVTCNKPVQSFFFQGDSWTLPVPIHRQARR